MSQEGEGRRKIQETLTANTKIRFQARNVLKFFRLGCRLEHTMNAYELYKEAGER